MIIGVAFVPSAPLLVPEVASGAAGELDVFRNACDEAVARALSMAPERVVVLGAGSVVREHRGGTGSLRGFGVGLDIPLDPARPSEDRLPLALTVGAWTLARHGWPGERAGLEVASSASRATLAAVATALAGEPFRSVLLVVADGSSSRTDRAPSSWHPAAEAFDDAVERALVGGRPHDLASLDEERATEVGAAGWPAWFVTGTAAAVAADGAWDAVLHAHEAPYGVGYFAASWLRR